MNSRALLFVFILLLMAPLAVGCGSGGGNNNTNADGDVSSDRDLEPEKEAVVEEEPSVDGDLATEEAPEQIAEEELQAEEEAVSDGDNETAEEQVAENNESTEVESETEKWPPEDPWWGVKVCNLPACDTGATVEVDLSGKWTQKLTALSHTCNPLIETIKTDIKPGAVTTKADQIFTLGGNCVYDAPGGTLTGVIHGDIMINCIIMPPSSGVTAMPTGWVKFTGNTGEGKSTVHLYDIPALQPSTCTVEYKVEYTRQ